MNKYQSGKIYKIVDNTSDMINVGSTCLELEKRLSGMKEWLSIITEVLKLH